MLPLPLSSLDERGTEERRLNTAARSRKRRRTDKDGVPSGHQEEERGRGEYVDAYSSGKYLYRVGCSLVVVVR